MLYLITGSERGHGLAVGTFGPSRPLHCRVGLATGSAFFFDPAPDHYYSSSGSGRLRNTSNASNSELSWTENTT
jgi:hypothetical protein